jgi:predicted dehydrogenase
MKRRNRSTRRTFLGQLATVGLVLPTFWVKSARAARFSVNERIALGFIGMGMMGRDHLRRFLTYPDVQVVAVCDVERTRLQDAARMVAKAYGQEIKSGQYSGVQSYVDFRNLLTCQEVDAVVISTPDHWHALNTILAAEAKKDIYCEKPLSRTIGEGRAMVRAVEAHGRVLQTGSQQRTEFDGKFRFACELVRNGYLGEIKLIRVGVGEPAIPCDLSGQPIPEEVDWDLWVGPAKFHAYNEVLCPKGIHNHFPAWRRYSEFAGGGLADMGAHHFDIAQWALGMDDSGPVEMYPPEGQEKYGLKFVYANGVVMFHGGPGGVTFEGTKGKLHVDRGVLESEPPDLVKVTLKPTELRLPTAENHHRDWLNAIRSRSKPICHAEVGHRSATVCHLANIGYWLRRPLRWDPHKESFVNDPEANALVNPPLRYPWSLPPVGSA